MPTFNASEWEDFLTYHPDRHLLQTTSWGELKSQFGWQVERVCVIPGSTSSFSNASGAQVLFRSFPFGFTLAYIPKGPVSDRKAGMAGWKELWLEVDRVCHMKKAVFLKVEPDLWIDSLDEDTLKVCDLTSPPPGFIQSQHSIQPLRTLVIPLHSDEDRILSRMKQKTRYNIKLALKKEVKIQPSNNFDIFHQLMEKTGKREKFGIHTREYYQRTHKLFHPKGECELLLAEFQGEPLAGLMVFATGRRAWYLYGASSNQHRDRMPMYLLQWEAIRWALSQGCLEYDLWGVPDVDARTLEKDFLNRNDGLWGVYRFKRGFGGILRRAAGPWDRVYNPILYAFYRWWVRK